MSFEVRSWASYALDLTPRNQSVACAEPSRASEVALHTPLQHMPPLLRRRLNPLGRATCQAAWDAHQDAVGIPVVFASRHGDCERTLRLLNDAARHEPMSPTDFTLSVHNAIGAVYSIARQDLSAYTSVAGGAASAAAGVIEATGLLADGAPEVLLVCYDTPLPGEYASFADERVSLSAWAWRMGPATTGNRHLRLDWEPATNLGDCDVAPASFSLQVHQFAISDEPTLQIARDGVLWTWSRNA